LRLSLAEVVFVNLILSKLMGAGRDVNLVVNVGTDEEVVSVEDNTEKAEVSFKYHGERSSTVVEHDKETLDSAGISVPEKLMAMYLAGRLSQGELVYKLKSYNMVVADTIIRESKHSPTRPIDYNDVPKASVDPVTHEADKPLPGTRGTKGEKDAGKGLEPARDEYSKEQEKKEQKEQEQIQQEQRTEIVVQTELVEGQNRQLVDAHLLRERIRKEEMEQSGELAVTNSLVNEGGVGERTKKGALDAALKRSRSAKRVEEIQKRRERLMKANVIARAGRGNKDRKQGEDPEADLMEDSVLEKLIEDWELFK
jgi:hypothetical protein